jgi:hypothetical protein
MLKSNKSLSTSLIKRQVTLLSLWSSEKRPSIESVLKFEKVTNGYVKAEEVCPNFLWSALRK